MPDTFQLRVVVSAPFDQNSYLAWFAGRTDCLLVDPGTEPELLIEEVDRHGLSPAAILITHGHGDHIAGNAACKARWPACPIVIGEHEAAKLTNPVLNLSAAFAMPVTSPPADVLVADEQVVEYAGFRLQVWQIPGHSSGHVVFYWADHQPPILFGGDVLFAGSIGRTDFPGGSFEQLAAGIHRRLFTLPDDTVVLSGHGEATTIGQEKRTNPFVGEAARRR